jgi:hypothetical protein
MKNRISLNSYPANYKEEDLPEVIIEIRYRKTTHDKIKANILANEIEAFLKDK